MAQNVTTFTESDFSRTFQPTTTDGSDHAWGSHHMVVGGAVQGGQIYGAVPDVSNWAARTTPTRAGAGFRPLSDRSIRRYAGILVRNPGIRAGDGVPESGELRRAEARVVRTRDIVGGRRISIRAEL